MEFMKLTKRQALDLVKVLSRQDCLNYDLEDLSASLENFLLKDEECEEDEGNLFPYSDDNEPCESVDYYEEKEDDGPSYDVHVAPKHMTLLPAISVILIKQPENAVFTFEGQMKISFEKYDDELDLCVDGVYLNRVIRIRRFGKSLAVMCKGDKDWYEFSVNKFPKEWTHKLPVGMTFKVERSK